MPLVEIPPALQKLTGNQAAVAVEAGTLADALTQLDRRFPGILEKIVHENKVRRYVSIFVDAEDVKFGRGVQTPLTSTSRISILIAIAGG
jgi:molybdopterin converting factor small subunit